MYISIRDNNFEYDIRFKGPFLLKDAANSFSFLSKAINNKHDTRKKRERKKENVNEKYGKNLEGIHNLYVISDLKENSS